MLSGMADEMRVYARHQLKTFLASMFDRVEFDTVLSTLQLRYRIPVERGNTMASPRGFEPLSPP